MDTVDVRRQMVQQQIRTWDVFDPAVLDVMGKLERADFVADRYAHVAYSEAEIPIGHGEKMMSPLIEGRLLQSLELGPRDSVLEIGTGSGYLSACLASLAGSVTSIDIYQEFVDMAADRLERCGTDNVSLHCMDATQQLPDGPFDVVAVTGSVPELQTSFVNVLRPGGRMFIVVGQAPVMHAQLITLGKKNKWQTETLFETTLAPLVNVAVPAPFSF